jgi:glycosyltransferase involved in cell wall biosynthesis
MDQQIRVGIPVVGGKSWLGGVATIEHLIRAISSLAQAERPKALLVVAEKNLPALAEYERFAACFDGLICIGHQQAIPLPEPQLPVFFAQDQAALFNYIDVLFPVSMNVIPDVCSVSWIDDFQHRRLPQFFPPHVIEQREATLGKVARLAKIVAVHTQDVKNDFHAFYPESKAIVKVLNYRVRQEPEWILPDPVEVQHRYQLPDRFLMCSNQFWMHKNHQCLFEAMALLKQQGHGVHLVCTGHTEDFRNPAYYSQLMQHAAKLGLSNEIHVLGLIPRLDQIQLLRRCLLVVQPSLFEGLGFIVQECAALGKHIVLSDLAVHKEQAAESTFFFDREDPTALARQIGFLLQAGLQPGPDRIREERARLLAEKNIRSFGLQFKQLMQFASQQFAQKPPIEPAERRDTWTALLKRLDAELTERKKIDPPGAAQAADEFLLTYGRRIQPTQTVAVLPRLLELWASHRRLPHRFGAMSAPELQRLVEISRLLRQQLVFLLQGDVSLLAGWSDRQQLQLVSLWRVLFLSPFSPLALSRNAEPAPTEGTTLPDCLIRSLFGQNPPAGEQMVNLSALLQAPAPGFLKVILCCWLVGTTYFGVADDERQRVCRYSRQICSVLSRRTDWVSFGAFATVMEEMMAAFWRISYAGGDHTVELSVLGDFITGQMNRFFPQRPLEWAAKKAGDRPLRIGYISRNFCKQAVSFYMVNRLIHHDPQRFDLHTFAVGDRDDELTEVFRQHSEEFVRHPQLSDMQGMIGKIRERQLDILIYADLGMDPFTLMLAGLRLAPVQCVLVGHGVTSGMPQIDYYISGDFEPPGAERHYREKLVRLPRLGAAQYPPFEPDKMPTRQDYKIPQDAVVYVTCANGIKLHPSRDQLFLEILRRVPQAWLVLKPFQTPDAVDARFMERIFAPARAAGVADRILIVPPFRQAKDVLGLLSFSDIQLDTWPYGGWTTNMEAVYMGLPLVTQDGAMARSRWGPAMLREMGIDAGIAQNEAEYVEWAVRLGTDHELRDRIRTKIREQARQVFFDGAAAQPAYEEMLRKIYGEKMGAKTR